MHVEHQEPTYRPTLPDTHSTPHTHPAPAEEQHTLDLQQAGEKAVKTAPYRSVTSTKGQNRTVEIQGKSPAQPSRPERILIVDDEYWITDVIYEQLSMEGFEADVTNTSADVMDMLSQKPYDLVLLDIYMPPPDGLTLLREIREGYPFLAILMLTAFSDADTASTAMREGASDYIVKPYQNAQLVSRIERAIERSQLLRERAEAQELLEYRVNEQTKKVRAQSKQLSQMLERVLVTYRATLKALEAALDVRDQSAPGHCRRVAKLAVQLATRMGFSGNDLVILEHGALLHDIGKMGIPDVILMKPGPLTEEEWGTMRKHPEIGCDIVRHIDFLQDALPIIRHHHEHFDGTGYPDGLEGEQIPMLARIFAVADSFDAQTNQRPYNVVHSIDTALENIRKDSGSLYDPKVVSEFMAMIKERELAEDAEHPPPGPADQQTLANSD
jgi:putative nucleotidyltransferase with HDIG domain